MRREPGLNRQILRLAVPALGALLAEPVFLLVDAAIVGHLGVAQLAGVGIASVILGTLVGLSVFLAYGTTAQVSRALGAGRPAEALTFGIAGLYLAAIIGVAVLVVCWPAAPVLIDWFGGTPEVADYGITF
ncbi:MAG TPA: MATE family efflux transporter, partial [Nakamurella sp.]